ncbi:MAG: 2-oxoglutarate dehydrogenase complex dihydrolipoyllysine-residue succinyltransferase [Holophagae bacterium]|jgi:2-oxoglutarate dehydrogenase E2 component (dihydrolipoamide succinyltransferase)
MAVDVTIPEIGESITEGFLAEWSQSNGAMVEAGTPLLVLETDKITMNVNADVGGRLEILVDEGSDVEVGQVVGRIDPDAADQGSHDEPTPDDAKKETEESWEEPMPEAPERGERAPATDAESTFDLTGLSPAVRRLVAEHELDPSTIDGTGKDGRILKADVLAYIDRAEQAAEAVADDSDLEAATPVEGPRPSPEPPAVSGAPRREPSGPTGPTAVGDFGQRQSREPMSRLRRRLAGRLVEVQQTAAILTTFNEVDMSRVMALRSRYKKTFEDKHGVGLGFMSFFVKAAVDALKTVPEVNAFIDGEDVVRNHYYDIGIAVSSDKGLVVPVVRDADRLAMADVEKTIAELAGKARDRTLQLDDLTGAVFTISNGGIFGSMMSTPILNPPGSAILGMHAITKRPVVVDDEIVIRPMMYLALSYDHRIIDGQEAVTFLKRIVECLEDPERLLLEV